MHHVRRLRQLVQHDGTQGPLILFLRSFYRLYFKGELLLSEITEAHHNDGGQHLCNGWINIALLHKELDEGIIEADTNQHQQEIAEQLHPSLQGGARKNDKPVQQVAGGETDGERNEEGHDMRTDSPRKCVYDLLIQDEIIADIINKYIKNGIAATTGSIPESLQRHPPPERRIEEIDYTDDPIFQHHY